MKPAQRLSVFVVSGIIAAAFLGDIRATAQYMYIDVDGDGINTTNDYLGPTTTSVDVYLDTSHNSDGSPAACGTGDGPLTIYSYEVIFRSYGCPAASFTYGSWTDHMSFPVILGDVRAGNDFYVGRGSATTLPPGLYRLGSLTLVDVAPGAALGIVASTTAAPAAYTSFGSQCVGYDFDNTLKLGLDWTDVAGAFGICDAFLPPNYPLYAEIDVSPLSHDFGRVNVGSSEAFSLSVQNRGTVTLNITEISSSNPDFTVSPESASVPPGTYAPPVLVTFVPSIGGASSSVVTFHSTAENGNGLYSVNVSGIGNTAPVLEAITDKTAFAFVELTFEVSATDAESDPIAYFVTGLPVGATFDGNTGHFTWTPGAADAGTYALSFTASDGLASTSRSMTIQVTALNNPPVANPGGPYSGATGLPIDFDGSASSDPDGNALTYLWDFGDGAAASGVLASHTYAVAGSYLVSLAVTDNGAPSLSHSAATSASVLNVTPAQIDFKLPANGILRVSGGGHQLVSIETTSIPVTAIDALSVKMSTDDPGAGTVREITATAAKGSSLGDFDRDNVQGLVVSFTRSSLNQLLGNLPDYSVVTIHVTAVSTSGAPIRGTTAVKVKGGGGAAVSAGASPNPFNPATMVSWALRSAGMATVRIYSSEGRLIRTLHDGPSPAGMSEAAWDGRDRGGRSVPTGVYFLSVKSAGMQAVRKLYLLK